MLHMWYYCLITNYEKGNRLSWHSYYQCKIITVCSRVQIQRVLHGVMKLWKEWLYVDDFCRWFDIVDCLIGAADDIFMSI